MAGAPDADGQRPLDKTPFAARCDIADHRDREDSSDPNDANEPTDRTDNAEPIEPIERTEPTDPIDSTEPFEPTLSTEPSDQSDHRDGYGYATRPLWSVGGHGDKAAVRGAVRRRPAARPGPARRVAPQRCRLWDARAAGHAGDFDADHSRPEARNPTSGPSPAADANTR
jgi:hypothetical protein